MPHNAKAAHLESAAGSPTQTHLSSTAFNRDRLSVVNDLHFGPCMVISGMGTGFYVLLRGA